MGGNDVNTDRTLEIGRTWVGDHIRSELSSSGLALWVLRSQGRQWKSQFDLTGKMSDLASSEYDPTGNDDLRY
jgi:hypothetical protein